MIYDLFIGLFYRNIGVPTIEGVLVDALLKNELIEPSHAEDMSKVIIYLLARYVCKVVLYRICRATAIFKN